MNEGGHILLVEDDFAIRETVADVLQGEGFEVSCAANGEEALRQLGEATAQPGVILLDLMMPVMDGWAFRSAQRRDPRISDIPVVVLSTGAGAEETLDRLAPDAFLPKPFELDRLLDVVGRYCTRHEEALRACAGPTLGATGTPRGRPRAAAGAGPAAARR